jgi:ubiquinone/menaquinone biosynthesis C-methylase UbiE
MADRNAVFDGSIPELYDRHLGPVIFAPYAADLAGRIASAVPHGAEVLEIACGTGIVTRELRRRLAPGTRLVATDLNEPMLLYARAHVDGSGPIEWRTADACDLPFAVATFDAVVCEFGFMFVPDKPRAFAEARRVLRPGGLLAFNVWDSLAANAFARITDDVLRRRFPADPPDFYTVPFSLHDADRLRRMLEEAGFGDIRLLRLEVPLGAESAASLAAGLVRGNPVVHAIVERGADPSAVERDVGEALAREGGTAPFESRMSALVVTARAPDGAW